MKTWHWILLAVLIAITLVLEFTVLADYKKHWWNHVPMFYGLFGFLGSVVLIFVAKGVGNILITRNEQFYDR